MQLALHRRQVELSRVRDQHDPAPATSKGKMRPDINWMATSDSTLYAKRTRSVIEYPQNSEGNRSGFLAKRLRADLCTFSSGERPPMRTSNCTSTTGVMSKCLTSASRPLHMLEHHLTELTKKQKREHGKTEPIHGTWAVWRRPCTWQSSLHSYSRQGLQPPRSTNQTVWHAPHSKAGHTNCEHNGTSQLVPTSAWKLSSSLACEAFVASRSSVGMFTSSQYCYLHVRRTISQES
eukprot:1110006-Amphidinium_carterae.1